MPVACEKTVLTGVDGSAAFIPAGTKFCLLDHADFPAGSDITVPQDHDYRLGDPVTFKTVGSAKLDTGLTVGTTYYITKITAGAAATLPKIEVSANSGGTAITLAGDGGTGTANTPGAANHIEISYAEHMAVCQVQSWTANLAREQIDTTALQCGPGTSGGKAAPFRLRQAGYVDGSGTLVVRFTRDQESLAKRLLANSLRKNQAGASVQLFIDTLYDGANKVDLAGSSYIEGPVSLLGFSLGVETGSNPTQGTINFSFSDQPTNVFGIV